MAGINKVILVGNLGKDPEVRTLESGRKVANFPLATTEAYKDKNGQRQEITEWHNIVFWTPFAEVAEKYLKKGSQIYVEGRIKTRSYDDKDGVKKYITEIVGQSMTMLGGRPSSDGAGKTTNEQAVHSTPAPIDDDMSDDLPF